MTAVLAREHPGLTINACCPGWVDTDMGNLLGRPPKTLGTWNLLMRWQGMQLITIELTVADGAKIPIRLGFGDIDGGVTGRYWGNPSVRDKGDGQVQAW